jgi:radical SAM superfamily enzyme YgiQ (UPF0313 family)
MARIACVFSIERYDTVDRPLQYWANVPFGLSMIATCLEAAGHEVRCWVICPSTPLDQIAAEMVNQFGCDLVAASAVTTQFPIIVDMCRQIKGINKHIPTVVGGAHPSLNPDDAIGRDGVDAICLGEGEAAAVAFADAIDRGERPAGIPGLWIKLPGEPGIDRTPPAPFEANLDALPLVNLRHWAPWVNAADRSFRIVIGRGCPYGCTYCSNHALKNVATGKYVRFRSPGNVLEEINRLVAEYPEVEYLFLEVETIGALPAVAIELCDQLAAFNARRAKPLEFRANLAVTTRLAQSPGDTHALLAAFQRANLKSINVGLESGSERIRKDVLSRPAYTNADLIAFCKAARQYDVAVLLFVMIGLPTETAADFLQTAATARACEPVGLSESIFYPYPGTKLFKLAADMCLIDPANLDTKAERARAYLDLEGFPRWRVYFEYVFITWRVFHGRWPLYKLARKMAYKTLSMSPGVLIAALRIRTAFAGTTARLGAND